MVAMKCFSLCSGNPKCVGFIVKATSNNENCQITNVTKEKNMFKSEIGNWKLFQDLDHEVVLI